MAAKAEVTLIQKEIRWRSHAFCQSFMTELAKHIGPDLDVPAGTLVLVAVKLAISLGLTNVLNNMMLVSLQENHWTFGEVKIGRKLPVTGSLFC